MLNSIKSHIKLINNAQQIVPLNKGFSNDKKYVIDDTYLLRLFRSNTKEARFQEFLTIKKLEKQSNFVPKAIEFNELKDTNFSYMVLEYLPGVDGEEALSYISNKEQYKAGYRAGLELKKLHTLQAPEHIQPWYKRKKQKVERYLYEFQQVPIDNQIKEMLYNYIQQNEFAMKNRSSTFQHDDFHPANLLIHKRSFSGIIDFQRMDWGDPLHDLTKIGFFAIQTSIPFSKGAIEGYFTHEEISKEFWELFALYNAMHVVSAFVWGKQMGEEAFNRLYRYSMRVIEEHDYFKRIIPKWYSNH